MDHLAGLLDAGSCDAAGWAFSADLEIMSTAARSTWRSPGRRRRHGDPLQCLTRLRFPGAASAGVAAWEAVGSCRGKLPPLVAKHWAIQVQDCLQASALRAVPGFNNLQSAALPPNCAKRTVKPSEPDNQVCLECVVLGIACKLASVGQA